MGNKNKNWSALMLTHKGWISGSLCYDLGERGSEEKFRKIIGGADLLTVNTMD